ncbi:hypothetical protein THASP1DRAFT_30540 [Thamnocephalis sphaerospora]|uniref:Up-regulated during septation protein 1 domain-containing protein n=1 Tax=Thamnocephalis sphaerospora TaxID=78915 RepID=A0A4V1IWI2_9FUNG|nr:hypothetical protein THASP1DRAFT_30540 [Thamnocephalis sphaerospora]|eukprot:RKP07649.1 hypothetical protein THASP1DRAFT_30540 [Thamnocephalis sphaerospora]
MYASAVGHSGKYRLLPPETYEKVCRDLKELNEAKIELGKQLERETRIRNAAILLRRLYARRYDIAKRCDQFSRQAAQNANFVSTNLWRKTKYAWNLHRAILEHQVCAAVQKAAKLEAELSAMQTMALNSLTDAEANDLLNIVEEAKSRAAREEERALNAEVTLAAERSQLEVLTANLTASNAASHTSGTDRVIDSTSMVRCHGWDKDKKPTIIQQLEQELHSLQQRERYLTSLVDRQRNIAQTQNASTPGDMSRNAAQSADDGVVLDLKDRLARANADAAHYRERLERIEAMVMPLHAQLASFHAMQTPTLGTATDGLLGADKSGAPATGDAARSCAPYTGPEAFFASVSQMLTHYQQPLASTSPGHADRIHTASDSKRSLDSTHQLATTSKTVADTLHPPSAKNCSQLSIEHEPAFDRAASFEEACFKFDDIISTINASATDNALLSGGKRLADDYETDDDLSSESDAEIIPRDSLILSPSKTGESVKSTAGKSEENAASPVSSTVHEAKDSVPRDNLDISSNIADLSLVSTTQDNVSLLDEKPTPTTDLTDATLPTWNTFVRGIAHDKMADMLKTTKMSSADVNSATGETPGDGSLSVFAGTIESSIGSESPRRSRSSIASVGTSITDADTGIVNAQDTEGREKSPPKKTKQTASTSSISSNVHLDTAEGASAVVVDSDDDDDHGTTNISPVSDIGAEQPPERNADDDLRKKPNQKPTPTKKKKKKTNKKGSK